VRGKRTREGLKTTDRARIASAPHKTLIVVALRRTLDQGSRHSHELPFSALFLAQASVFPSFYRLYRASLRRLEVHKAASFAWAAGSD
jgi:hypothetical protein